MIHTKHFNIKWDYYKLTLEEPDVCNFAKNPELTDAAVNDENPGDANEAEMAQVRGESLSAGDAAVRRLGLRANRGARA